MKRKVGVTERPGSLNPIKGIAIVICTIIVHFSTWRARSVPDVAFQFACAVRMRRNNKREYEKKQFDEIFYLHKMKQSHW